MKEPKFLNTYKTDIKDQFKELLNLDKSEFYFEPISDYLIIKNSTKMPKRIRSSIFLEILNGLEKDYNVYTKLACGIEYLHEFSLVHDDIQDKDEIRRGNSTLWKEFGTEKSILLGNIIKIISDTITSDYNSKIKASTAKEVIKTFNTVCINMIEGQYLDIMYEDESDISLENYLYMISRKTGALMSLSFYLPSILHESEKQDNVLFKTLGDIFGLLFQISDDMLGIWGDPSDTGKSNFSDFENNKKTYPILLAKEKFSKKDKKIFNELYSNDKKLGGKDLTDLMDSYNIKSIIKSDCLKYIECSRDLISKTNLQQTSKKNLNELFDYVIERVK